MDTNRIIQIKSDLDELWRELLIAKQTRDSRSRDKRIREAKTAISNYAQHLPSEVLGYLDAHVGTNALDSKWVDDDIHKCIDALGEWKDSLEKDNTSNSAELELLMLSRSEALELLSHERFIAWRESDQGFGAMLCSNGQTYYRCELSPAELDLPIDKREELKNNTFPGWQCIYCGLGHRIIMREEYYSRFNALVQERPDIRTKADIFYNAFTLLSELFSSLKSATR